MKHDLSLPCRILSNCVDVCRRVSVLAERQAHLHTKYLGIVRSPKGALTCGRDPHDFVRFCGVCVVENLSLASIGKCDPTRYNRDGCTLPNLLRSATPNPAKKTGAAAPVIYANIESNPCARRTRFPCRFPLHLSHRHRHESDRRQPHRRGSIFCATPSSRRRKRRAVFC